MERIKEIAFARPILPHEVRQGLQAHIAIADTFVIAQYHTPDKDRVRHGELAVNGNMVAYLAATWAATTPETPS
jgi:hypothetical protein